MSKISRWFLKRGNGDLSRRRRPRLMVISDWLTRHKALGVFIVTLCGALAWFLPQAPLVLKNVHDLPELVQPVANRFLAWHYDDKYWTGTWSSFPEGHVDIGDMKLSDTDMQFELQAVNGTLDGTVTSKKVCDLFPYLQSFLLKGNVNSKAASVDVFDYIEGKRVNILRLSLVRDANVITVSTVEGNRNLFPRDARLGLHPSQRATPQQQERAAYCGSVRSMRTRKSQH